MAKASSDVANDRFTAEEWRARSGEDSKPGEQEKEPAEAAVAIDPGRRTGVAWTDGKAVHTETSSFWEIWERLSSVEPPPALEVDAQKKCAVVLEALYKSRQSVGAGPKIAYNSGQAAREAELLATWVREAEYPLIEHDPSSYQSKWDSRRTKQIVGDWEGPDNEHTRDAIRLLFAYGYI